MSASDAGAHREQCRRSHMHSHMPVRSAGDLNETVLSAVRASLHKMCIKCTFQTNICTDIRTDNRTDKPDGQMDFGRRRSQSIGLH